MPSWLTHDNHARPFLVEQKGDQVSVYNVHSKKPSLVKRYEVDKVFVGKSPLNPTTEFSGGHGKEFDGNSVLLKLKDGKRYVFVGERVYEFRPPEPIEKFYSSLGNNDVPYPVALGKSNAYFLLEQPVVAVRKSDLGSVKDWSDAYGAFYSLPYGHQLGNAVKTKTIANRPGWPSPKPRQHSRHWVPRLKTKRSWSRRSTAVGPR